MTYGQIRLRLSKLAPGIDLELLDGWIQDRYTEILDALPWKRLEGESVFQSPASYAVGTVSATQGSSAIAGVGTTWTAAMNGLMTRINNGAEYYNFTYVSATTATLDRPFEQVSGTGFAYRIDQAVFLLPAACRVLRAILPFHNRRRPLQMISPAELDRLAPQRTTYGTPVYAAASWDSYTDPPVMQVELYPVPSNPDSVGNTLSWMVDYIYDPAGLNPSLTSTNMLPWVRPAALIEGVTANIKRHLKDYQGAEEHKKEFASLLVAMARINALQRGPQPIRLAPELRRQVASRFNHHRWHEGSNE